MMKELFGEFLGTLILILLGNGVVAGVVLPKTKSNNFRVDRHHLWDGELL